MGLNPELPTIVTEAPSAEGERPERSRASRHQSCKAAYRQGPPRRR